MTASLADSAFVRACRRRPVPHTPVWFMRQAGRSLPEYRRLREGVAMLDAAILFSDIVLPLKSVGVDLDIVPGTGPVVATPVASASDVEAIPALAPGHVEFVTEAVQELVKELGETPLIGFAGAPFTLASYLVEGGPSRDHARTKAMMHGAPQVWHALAARLADVSATFLEVQVGAGAAAVQLFDSWAGALSPADYAEFVQPHSRRVLERIGKLDVPRIHFGVGTGELLPLMAQAGSDVVGVDWRVPLDEASRRVGPGYAVQGNLDPALVFAPWEVLADKVREVLAAGRRTPGHVFNLGHGVLPSMDPDVLARIVDLVHTESVSTQ